MTHRKRQLLKGVADGLASNWLGIFVIASATTAVPSRVDPSRLRQLIQLSQLSELVPRAIVPANLKEAQQLSYLR